MLQSDVAHVLGIEVVGASNVGGSSWASCVRVDGSDGSSYFVKACNGGQEMIEGEAWSLAALHHGAKGTSMAIPAVHYSGPAPNSGGSMLVTDFLTFGGRPSQYEFGHALAQLHLAEPLADEAKEGKFGFPVDNTLGPTPQPNSPFVSSWVDFFREYRLQHQLKMTGDSKLQAKGNQLCENLDQFFHDVEVKPAVLHGDLWSGNIAAVNGKPSVFDPATYYGHSALLAVKCQVDDVLQPCFNLSILALCATTNQQAKPNLA